MELTSFTSGKRKTLALTGVAAAAAVLSSQEDSQAQGYYQYSQYLGNVSTTTGRGSPGPGNGNGQYGNAVSVSLPGLNTTHPVSSVSFFEIGAITFSQV